MSTPARASRLAVEDRGDIAIAKLVDKKIVTEEAINQIGEDLYSLVDELGKKRIVVSFANVEYYSSACIGRFLTLQKKVKAVGGGLVLCDVNDDIFEVFEITRHNRTFKFAKDESAALELF